MDEVPSADALLWGQGCSRARGESVANRVDEFTEQFESVIAEHRLYVESLPLLDSASRQAARLGDTLEQLADSAGVMKSVSPADIRSLQQELSSLKPASGLEGHVTKARALLQVIDDGLVDGDATRLRLLMAEAESISPARTRTRSSAQIHLPTPARARCVECDSVIVGMRQAAGNWNAITKVIRDHERDVHGAYSEALRDELTDGLARLRAGEALVVAGRYEIGSL